MNTIYEPKGRALEYSLLALNLYNGCDNNCTYCYVADMPQWANKDFYATPAEPRKGIISALEKAAPKFAGTDKRVLLCFSCDPYQPIEGKLGLTRSALRILRNNNIPFAVLTKGGSLAIRDFYLYRPGVDAFAGTLTFLDELQAAEYEPNAAPPAERIRTLKAAHNAGIETWVSLEPVIDPAATIEIINQTAPFVDLFKIGTLNHRQTNTDWKKFGTAAIAACRKNKTNYYIKDDLAKHLAGVSFFNSDNRKVTK